MESCQCTQGPDDADTKPCELCCKEPGEDKPCLSSFELNEPPFDMPDMVSKPGTPCNNYQGYCDVFQKCREVSKQASHDLCVLFTVFTSSRLSLLLQLFLCLPFTDRCFFLWLTISNNKHTHTQNKDQKPKTQNPKTQSLKNRKNLRNPRDKVAPLGNPRGNLVQKNFKTQTLTLLVSQWMLTEEHATSMALTHWCM